MATMVEKNIGGRTFLFRRCSATNALDLQLSLAKVGASELLNMDMSALSGLTGEAVTFAIGAQIGGLLGAAAQKLSLSELTRLMKLVFNHVDCDGKTIGDSIDEVFADRPADTWLVFVEALKVNLGPLFDALRRSLTGASSAKG